VSIILPALSALIMSASATKRPLTYPSDPLLTSGPMENFRDVYIDPHQAASLITPLTDPSSSRPRAVITKDRVEINNHIFFSTNSDVIKPSSHPILAAVAASLKRTPGAVQIQIQGHTDTTGDADNNLALSARRARSVMQFLVSQGVTAERLESKGFGQSQPLDHTNTEEGQQANRRVEFVIQRWSDVPKMMEVDQIGDAPAAAQADGNSLEIANSHSIWVEITVNGQKVGTVGPYTVAAIHGLEAGLYDVGFTHPTGYTYYRPTRTSHVASPIIPGGKNATSILPNNGLPSATE